MLFFYESCSDSCTIWVQFYINLNSNNLNLPSKNSNQCVKSAKHSCRIFQGFHFSLTKKVQLTIVFFFGLSQNPPDFLAGSREWQNGQEKSESENKVVNGSNILK